MKSIVLIHTVQSLAVSFSEKLQNFIEEDIKIYNIWDDFLANNPNEIGEFSIENRNRLFNIIKTAELTGANIIVTTCSTLTPIVKMIRPFIKIPIIAIDDAVTKKAAETGNHILILATANSAVEPTKQKIEENAALVNKNVKIDFMIIDEAFKYLKLMNMKKHDSIIKEKISHITGFDCIVLAQASMAHLENEISNITKCSVLSSPNLCMNEIKNTLKNL